LDKQDDIINEEVKPRWSKKEIAIGIIAIIATIAMCIAGVYYKDEIMSSTYLTQYGLVGVGIVSFLAGSTFSVTAVPVPYWLVVFTMPPILAEEWGILAPVWVGIISALGASVGQLITFMIGYGGRGISEKVSSKIGSKYYDRAISWAQRHGSWAVFLMSAIVNPLHLPMTIAIATLRYPPHKFFIFCFLGVAVKSLVIAFCGYYGVTQLLSWLGV